MTFSAPNGAPDPEPISPLTTALVMVGVVVFLAIAAALNHFLATT